MDLPVPPVVDFYSRHPISEGQIVDALRRQGKNLERLQPEDLDDLDQDHYGGLEAVEVLGRGALQRNSRSRNFLTAAGSWTLMPVGTTRNDPPLPVTWARNSPALWVITTAISVRPSARA